MDLADDFVLVVTMLYEDGTAIRVSGEVDNSVGIGILNFKMLTVSLIQLGTNSGPTAVDTVEIKLESPPIL